jgi:hypothetical protein
MTKDIGRTIGGPRAGYNGLIDRLFIRVLRSCDIEAVNLNTNGKGADGFP